MTDCIFCKIAAGEIPAYKVHETKSAFAFLDIHPHAQGHTVVIPKIHAKTLFDLNDVKTKEFFLAVKVTMHKLEEKLHPDGFNVGWNQLEAAGQVVPHLNIHIFPRYLQDGGGSFHSIAKNPGKLSVEEVAGLFK